MHLVCVLFIFENNTGYTDLRTTDTPYYRNVTAHLKNRGSKSTRNEGRESTRCNYDFNKRPEHKLRKKGKYSTTVGESHLAMAVKQPGKRVIQKKCELACSLIYSLVLDAVLFRKGA